MGRIMPSAADTTRRQRCIVGYEKRQAPNEAARLAPAAPPHWLGRLNLATPAGELSGERRIRLLEAIDEHGSITRAAKAVPLSYKAAWDALDALNNLAERPLVERSAGGRRGGGTRLTDARRELVALYRAAGRAAAHAGAGRARARARRGCGAVGSSACRRRCGVWRCSSARNQFAGRVGASLPGRSAPR